MLIKFVSILNDPDDPAVISSNNITLCSHLVSIINDLVSMKMILRDLL